MNVLIRILLIMVILTTLGSLVGQVVLWAPPVSDNDTAIGGETDSGEEEKKPEISVNISTAVTPDASGKVPTGGVNIAGETASVVVPEGVQMEEGATELALSVESISEPNEDVPVAKNESANAIDVHIDGVAKDNSVPMLITIKELFSKGLNTTSVKMYHVENGAPVEMALVSEPANHNEFSYDPATGDVVMCVASFSEYVTVENDYNFWEGKAVTDWYNDTDTEFTLSTAEQLAGLGAIVDGGYTKPDGTTVTLTADDFAGKTILLGADIDLYGTDESGNRLSFNPIGFKYPGAKDDEGNDISKIFRGTFDGQNHTIKNLYQNGWAMGLSYSNAGGGLFAGVQNATIKNLIMKGADIVMEAVPMGTVAAYAYGECTFDNIRITSSTLQNYNWDIAAIVGGVNGKHTFSNIYIENSVTLSSLWGSFGGGIGGVIGSVYGGHNGNNKITMQNVNVACVLDVYNDVTSAYQWYAYRFCGMLIGNTNEPGADGKNAYTAQASFLKCENVKVYYGDWVNYHYCKFTNQDIAWQNNYPWVRVEAGLSNPGYSNARYGHPIVDGVAVTAENHTHNGDDCNLLIEFNQLYGGDQGVYGQPEHEGVTTIEYAYSITYVNNYEVLAIEYVPKDTEWTLDADDTIKNRVPAVNGAKCISWSNAGSNVIETLPANYGENIVVYPTFEGVYTARFVDQDGNVLKYVTFTNSNYSAVTDAKNSVAVPGITDFEFDYWEIHTTNSNGELVKTHIDKFNFGSVKSDITVYPVYIYQGKLNMTGVDEDGDGDYEYYQVDAIDGLVGALDVPGEVNGLPVRKVVDISSDTINGSIGSDSTGITDVNFGEGVKEIGDGALAMTADLERVSLPSTIEYIGGAAFANTIGGSIVQKKIEITFNGTIAQWNEKKASFASNWDNGLVTGSVVICTDGYYVLTAETFFGYGTYTWTPHNHLYDTTCPADCISNQ